MYSSREDWVAISGLLDQALELDGEARSAWLETLPESVAPLREELRSLLERHASIETNAFLVEPPRIQADDSVADERGPTEAPPAVVGGYEIESEIGRGGAGVVYRARRRDGPTGRPVALKLLQAARYAPDALARFARERDILATLEHPNIARLYDAGTAEDGQPFIALEFVAGLPLDAYCDRERLTIRQRLKLFRTVLEAVRFAHANLIVHRDLKPSNILVGANGETKLLDFGIAKQLTESGSGAATEYGPMTPDFAAPEQVLGATVTTATDVYALGVVLFLLLTGRRPYRVARASRGALEEAILRAEPPRPSDAVDSEAADARRAPGLPALRRELRGDLDTIVAKALQKAPSDRYATVDALLRDLDNHLAGRPVEARPDQLWYRCGRFIRRNRIAVAAAAVAMMTISAALAIALWQARRAGDEARAAQAAQHFLEEVFEANSRDGADPARAQKTTARELLAQGTARVDSALAGSPRARLEILETLGRLHHDLGLDEQATALQQKRVDLAKQLYGARDLRVAAALRDLSLAITDTNRVRDRPSIIAEALQILDRHGDRDSDLRADLLGDLAQHYFETDLTKALDYARQSLAIVSNRPPSQPLQEALVMQGTILAQLGRYSESAPLLERAVEVSTKVYGADNSHLPRLYAYLAESLYFLPDLAGAERAYRAAYRIALVRLGPDHLDTWMTGARLGNFLCRTSRAREGVGYLRLAWESVARTLPPDDAEQRPTIQEMYGWELARFGDLDEGERMVAAATAAWRRNHDGTDYMLSALERLAYLQVDQGRFDSAQALLREADSIRKKLNDYTTYPNGNPVAHAHLGLARGDWAGAEAAIRGLRVPSLAHGGVSPQSLERDVLQAELALRRGAPDRAVELAAQTLEGIRASPSADWARSFEARALAIQGEGLLNAGSATEALPVLERATRAEREIFDGDADLEVASVELARARCLARLSRPAQARAAYAAAMEILGRHVAVDPRLRAAAQDARRLLPV